MSKQQEALRLALEALEPFITPNWAGSGVDEANAAYTALRKALAEQPAQQHEPFEIEWPEYNEHAMGCGLEDRDERCRYGAMRYGWDCAIEAVAQALPEVIYITPQPPAQQEPVAALQRVMTRLADLLDEDQFAEIEGIVTNAGVMPPAQRTWVGLTDDDKKTPDMGKYVFLSDDWIDGYKTGLEKAEAKLKEKNSGN